MTPAAPIHWRVTNYFFPYLTSLSFIAILNFLWSAPWSSRWKRYSTPGTAYYAGRKYPLMSKMIWSAWNALRRFRLTSLLFAGNAEGASPGQMAVVWLPISQRAMVGNRIAAAIAKATKKIPLTISAENVQIPDFILSGPGPPVITRKMPENLSINLNTKIKFISPGCYPN